jgi:hypothetical protein
MTHGEHDYSQRTLDELLAEIEERRAEVDELTAALEVLYLEIGDRHGSTWRGSPRTTEVDHYPETGADVDDCTRASARELWGDLCETPRGFSDDTWPAIVEGRARLIDIDKAMRWLVDVGAPLLRDGNCWRITDLESRAWRYPTHALSRLDLLDELRVRLGSDVDPIDAITQLVRAETDRTWHRVWSERSTWTRKAGDVLWRLSHREGAACLFVGAASGTGGLVLVAESTQHVKAVQAWADWIIAEDGDEAVARLRQSA